MIARLDTILTALIIFTLSAAPVAAQTRATSTDLTGVVYDQSRGVLPGALVTATNADTNISRTTSTNGEGRYTIPALAPGRYTVTCELAGFAPYDKSVTLAIGTAVAQQQHVAAARGRLHQRGQVGAGAHDLAAISRGDLLEGARRRDRHGHRAAAVDRHRQGGDRRQRLGAL